MKAHYQSVRIRQFFSALLCAVLFVIIIFPHLLSADTKIQFGEEFDEYINNKMDEIGIPGAVIVIVKDGKLFFSRGYGYANIEDKIPVDPAKTLFRVGSISKVVTGTAVMQQVELGHIDLNADVNTYLETFKIPRTFKKPVTTAHLLTHTAGFDDRYIGKSARTIEDRISLAEYCRRHLPQRFIAPGEMYTYSNYGNALAGYLVECVSGIPFAEYIDSAILKPLNLNYSGFELSADLEPYLARGYSDLRGGYRVIPFDYILDAPAGQLVSSGEDMARFMLVHLQGGELDGKRILSGNTIAEMHSRQFTNHPALHDGVGYTFDIRTMNGRRTISHGGAYAGFYALMSIFPEENAGVFIAHNILKTNFINRVMDYITGELFNDAKAVSIDRTGIVPEQFDADVRKFTGTYRHTRYPRNTYDKLGVLSGAMGGEMKLRMNDGDMLLMPDIFGNDRRLIKTGPLLFQSLDDNYTLAFRENRDGRITHVFTSGTNAMERIPWYYTVALHRYLFVIFPFFFLTVMLLTVFRSIVRKLRPEKIASVHYRNLPMKRLHLWIAVSFILYIVMSLFVIGISVSVEEIVSGFPYGLPGMMYLVQMIPFITIVLIITLLYYVVRDWFHKNMPIVKRLYYSGYILVSTAAILFLGYWNLIGFNF